MEVTWYADDGYVNPGPHTVEVDDDELRECETDAQRLELVEEAIQEDFGQKVSWYYDTPDFSELGEAEENDS